MRALVLLACATLTVGTPAAATVSFAGGFYWVIGNRATSKCEIVTSNPVITGDIWFEDGPYRSLRDARLARSTIRICPEKDPSADG